MQPALCKSACLPICSGVCPPPPLDRSLPFSVGIDEESAYLGELSLTIPEELL